MMGDYDFTVPTEAFSELVEALSQAHRMRVTPIDQLQAMAEARQGSGEPVAEVIAAAQDVIDRWDSPLWKDVAPTAEYIGRLRAAVEKHKAAPPSAQQATGSGQVLTDAAAISILGSAMAKAAGRNLPNDNAWLLAGARAILAAATQAQPEVTDEMVTAYLKANDAYWQRTDTAPATDPSRWRNGNPRDATRESLRAALAAPTTGKREPLPDGFQLVAVKGFDDLVYWLDRCADKGHLEQCSDLIEPWAAFEFRRLDGITGEQR
jgi:hypothetical protein